MAIQAYRKLGKGNAVVGYLLRKAVASGYTRVFALTTRTSHWFAQRGFREAQLVDLPAGKQNKIGTPLNPGVVCIVGSECLSR